ncbi:hypothetical protein PIB30_008481 [Stylosanthes scabra]|uniref:Ribonuclease H1 N-terminal domain-containing protein n=1 Tax=Stylosanthes scabra TaxID=79078 RepID=A0ABU6Y6J9_9FABA|nr:hypothetical protein [Stylosanthes scabra]
MSRARYSHYAVRIGRVPGIYRTWDECNEQVHGYPFASYKGFKSLEEATEYLNKEPSRSRLRNETESVETLSPELNKLGVGSSGGHAHAIPATSTQSTSSSSVGASGLCTVPETQRGGLVIEEDMELYLLRVCAKLHLGSPHFEKHVYHSQEGEKHYRFEVTLVCEEEEINLKANGCFSFDEACARDDAAYTLLDLLLIRTGHSICDFNYRRLCVLQQQFDEMQGTQPE